MGISASQGRSRFRALVCRASQTLTSGRLPAIVDGRVWALGFVVAGSDRSSPTEKPSVATLPCVSLAVSMTLSAIPSLLPLKPFVGASGPPQPRSRCLRRQVQRRPSSCRGALRARNPTPRPCLRVAGDESDAVLPQRDEWMVANPSFR